MPYAIIGRWISEGASVSRTRPTAGTPSAHVSIWYTNLDPKGFPYNYFRAPFGNILEGSSSTKGLFCAAWVIRAKAAPENDGSMLAHASCRIQSVPSRPEQHQQQE